MHGQTGGAADGGEENLGQYVSSGAAMGSYGQSYTPGTNLRRRPGSIGELEELVREMEGEPELSGLLPDGQSTVGVEVETDVYTQLQKKEQDLLLAAELGKALLEKNQELKKRNDQLTDEIEVSDSQSVRYVASSLFIRAK